MAGFVPTENMRFRDEELTFVISDTFEEMKTDKAGAYKYPKVHTMLFSFIKNKEILNLLSNKVASRLLK